MRTTGVPGVDQYAAGEWVFATADGQADLLSFNAVNWHTRGALAINDVAMLARFGSVPVP